MAIFVLVHGAWGGAHGFRKVRGPLRAAGHEVFTPGLTGVGERVHLTSPQVCLTTHVTDVVNTVLYEDLHGIVLLGFSYGGFVTTGALEHIGKVGYDPLFGARPLKRAIQQEIENPLAKELLTGQFGPGDTVQVAAKGGRIAFSRATAKAA